MSIHDDDDLGATGIIAMEEELDLNNLNANNKKRLMGIGHKDDEDVSPHVGRPQELRRCN